MKEYEHDLQYLIDLSNGGCKPVHQKDSDMDESQLRFLSAKGFLSLKTAGDNEFWICIEPLGLSYFSDKVEKRTSFVKEHIINFISGFVSGILVTVIAAWIIQAMQ